jgi:hypothetical protein
LLQRAFLLLICAVATVAIAAAQDLLSVTSPDGHIELRLGVMQPPEPGAFLRIGYSIEAAGKEVIAPSYLGYWIHDQEPILGETVGLSASKRGSADGYNWILAEFLQDGSRGRRINIEVRVYNDRVVFRYLLPRSTPLDGATIDTEETQFRITGVPSLPAHAALPFLIHTSSGPWVGIGETTVNGYPPLSLIRDDEKTLLADVALPKTGLPLGSPASLTSPWRIIAISGSEPDVRAALGTAIQ